MSSMLSTSGMELLKHFEGCKLEAYQDTGGVWTIGIGTTCYPFGAKVKKGDKLENIEQAIALMEHDVKIFELAVAKLVHVPIDQNEFDALVVLVYNIGIGRDDKFGRSGFMASTLLKKINVGASINDIEKAWMMWVYDDGRVIDGLVRRRKAEFHLYKTGTLKFYFND